MLLAPAPAGALDVTFAWGVVMTTRPDATSRSEQCVRALEEAEAGIRELMAWDCMTRASLTALESALQRLEVAMAEARIGLFLDEQD